MIWLCFFLLILVNCLDFGFFVYGNRNVFYARRLMDDGIIISFLCDFNYIFRGVKKIICIKGRWNGKKLICKVLGMYYRFLKIC